MAGWLHGLVVNVVHGESLSPKRLAPPRNTRDREHLQVVVNVNVNVNNVVSAEEGFHTAASRFHARTTDIAIG